MNVGACGRRVAPSSWIPARGISSGMKLKRVWFRGYHRGFKVEQLFM